MAALVLVALSSVVLNSWVWSQGISRVENGGLMLNMAGKQRALNERIRTVSLELVQAESPRLIGQLREELTKTVDEYELAHAWLTGELGAHSESIQAMYLEEPVAVDLWLSKDLVHARALLAASDSELVIDNPDLQYLQDSRRDLFARHDKVVSQFQLEEEQKIRSLYESNLWLNGFTITVLAIAGLFIFVPMEKRIRKDRLELEAANAALDAVLQEEKVHRQRLASLYQIAERTLGDRDHVSLMQRTSDYLFSMLTIQSARVYSFEQDAQELVLRAATGVQKPLRGKEVISAGPNSKAALMLAATQPMYSGDIEFDGWLEDLSFEHETSVDQVVAVAIRGSGQPLGVILVMAGSHQPVGPEEIQYIQSLASLLGIACEGIESHENLHKMQREFHRATRVSALGELGTSLAHELNQPLVAIMNYADACRRVLKAEVNATHHNGQPIQADTLLEKVANEAERAGNIIKHMRDYLETGELHENVLDINRLVCETVELAKVEYSAAGVTIGLSLDPELPKARFDKIQLQQVMYNLLRVARRDTRGAEERRIRITTQIFDERMIEVVVEDSGQGEYWAALNARDYIPFAAREDKMGIGLSVCKTIIGAHGGQIWATRAKALPQMKKNSSVHFTLFNERG